MDGPGNNWTCVTKLALMMQNLAHINPKLPFRDRRQNRNLVYIIMESAGVLQPVPELRLPELFLKALHLPLAKMVCKLYNMRELNRSAKVSVAEIGRASCRERV